MIWHYITLFLIAVLGGALGGLIVHAIWYYIQDRKLRKWRYKESDLIKAVGENKWKDITETFGCNFDKYGN